jgi:hypothetical protein
MLPVPPYALATPRPRFPALAARAARAPLGGGREAVLAVLVLARLAAGQLSRPPLTAPLREARAAAARTWLGALTLPAPLRPALLRALEATGGDAPALREALESVIQVTSSHLDRATVGEVQALVRELGG